MTAWVWKALSRHYLDVDTGRLVNQGDLTRLRDQYIQHKSGSIRDLTTSVAEQRMSISTFEREMRSTLRTMHLTEYALARGGAQAMTPRDYGSVGRALRDQYGYLRGFVEDVGEGKLTGPQMLARADLYAGSVTASFERGRARSFGIDLPGYPADGGTECGGRCRCYWAISQEGRVIQARWQLDGLAEHCDGCLRRYSEWSPFEITLPEEE